ncbi:MAG: universal stress protein [Desulfobacter sp.]|nr:MAG: universal stress protein [Desulfobacter sp.]
MKQILLAIDGDTPTRPVYQYTADLCRQVKAELCILQFTTETQVRQCSLSTPKPDSPSLKTSAARQGGVCKADPILTGVPAPLKKMLKSPDCPVPFKVTLSAGTPETQLSDYIDTHHDIILTVYDPSLDRRRATGSAATRINALKGKLQVPLVIVNSEKRAAPSRP